MIKMTLPVIENRLQCVRRDRLFLKLLFFSSTRYEEIISLEIIASFVRRIHLTKIMKIEEVC